MINLLIWGPLDLFVFNSLAGKIHSKSFPLTGTITNKLLALIHGDLVQMPVRTASGYRYFVAFYDDALSYHAAYLLRTKDETFEAFKAFKAWAEEC